MRISTRYLPYISSKQIGTCSILSSWRPKVNRNKLSLKLINPENNLRFRENNERGARQNDHYTVVDKDRTLVKQLNRNSKQDGHTFHWRARVCVPSFGLHRPTYRFLDPTSPPTSPNKFIKNSSPSMKYLPPHSEWVAGAQRAAVETLWFRRV